MAGRTHLQAQNILTDIAEAFRKSEQRKIFNFTAVLWESFKLWLSSPVGIAVLVSLIVLCVSIFVEATFSFVETGSLLVVLTLYILVAIILSVSSYLDTRYRLHEPLHALNFVLLEFGERAGHPPTLDELLPISDSLDAYLTEREELLCHVPALLLVEGDIVMLRPGQCAPEECRILTHDKKPTDKIIKKGAMAEIDVSKVDGLCHNNIVCELLKTPLYEILYNCSSLHPKKPPPSLLTERKYFEDSILIRYLVPVLFLLALLVGLIRHMFNDNQHWSYLVITQPWKITFPLLPVLLPVLWFLLVHIGTAAIIIQAELSSGLDIRKSMLSFSSSFDIDVAEIHVSLGVLLSTIKSLWSGGLPQYLPRTTNPLLTLGNVNVLCCVDKKGILSYANATPERMFVFSEIPTDSYNELGIFAQGRQGRSKNRSKSYQSTVLNLSHDGSSLLGTWFQFDDVMWRHYLSSLKPIGLAIKLNTCNIRCFRDRERFFERVCSLACKMSVPATAKRCLCHLAHIIGFTPDSCSHYKFIRHIGVHRNTHPWCNQYFSSGRSSTGSCEGPRVKPVLPNFDAVIVRDRNTGYHLLVCEGTADIVIQHCSTLWDGNSLQPLTESTKRHVLDIYNRNSTSAYCTAFSFKPLLSELPQMLENYVSVDNKPGKASRSSSSRNKRRVRSSLSFEQLSMVNESSELINNQIFLGMVATQYQVKPEVYQLVDSLEGCCIRFVHFSKDNEVRSRVFSEKMGLEAGWNCHISLASTTDASELRKSNEVLWFTSPRKISRSQSHVELLQKPPARRDTMTADQRYTTSRSIGTGSYRQTVQHQTSRDTTSEHVLEGSARSRHSSYRPSVRDEGSSIDQQSQITAEGQPLLSYSSAVGDTKERSLRGRSEEADGSVLSDSELKTQSTATDSFAIAFMNRAKLPTGVENIRSHIDNVDNVPLLVHLFTDCTSAATQEMIKIMQEYDEVVCCVGSALNSQNLPIFAQADLRQFMPKFYSLGSSLDYPTTDVQLASALGSLPCSFRFSHGNIFTLFHIIVKARSVCYSIRVCLTTMLSLRLLISAVQFVSMLFALPPLFAHHIIWLCWVIIPIMSLCLYRIESDSYIAKMIVPKRNAFRFKTIVRFAVQFLCQLGPTIFFSALCSGLIHNNICSKYSGNSCTLFSSTAHPPLSKSNYSNSSIAPISLSKFAMENPDSFVLADNFTTCLMLFYCVVFSFCYTNPLKLMWKVRKICRPWAIATANVVVLQIIFTVADVMARRDLSSKFDILHIANIPAASWILAILSMFVQVLCVELVKRNVIKLTIRNHKRAKLEFGTKLGMNSPF